MKKSVKIIIAVVAVVVILAAAYIGVRNDLVTAQEAVQKCSGDIDTNLQRRADLIPNLVETVKGYAKHEDEVFTAVSEARAALASASTIGEKSQASGELDSAVSRLLAIAEAYPELKASDNFLDLQAQLEGTENRISTSRVAYNEAVQNYNTKIRRFPGSLFAGMMGLEQADYFEADEGSKEVPSVKFGD